MLFSVSLFPMKITLNVEILYRQKYRESRGSSKLNQLACIRKLLTANRNAEFQWDGISFFLKTFIKLIRISGPQFSYVR